MAGGLLQLAGYGNQDNYLTGSPHITYFKAVYRRYTNFSMESISLEFDKSELSFDQSQTFKRKLDRNADLVGQVYFTFTLPEIQSSSGRQFYWVRNIGTSIIDSVSVFIQGRKIDQHYGEWIHIWHELNLGQDLKDNYNQMTGNIPEIYAPDLADGNNGIYPDSTIDVDFIPSIASRRIWVPMVFWFNRHPGLAIPLIALQYHEVEFQFTMRPIQDLYTIMETDPTQSNYGYRVRPLGSVSAHGIENFLTSSSLARANTDGSRSLISFDINPTLEANYIFLDSDERRRFANVNHEYLIERVFRLENTGLSGSGTHSLDLDLHHPTKELVWVTKRSDTADHNDHTNFTGWVDQVNPPYSLSYYNPYGSTTEITSSNFANYKEKDILNEAKILLNGYDRFKEQTSTYFNRAQAYQHHSQTPQSGIYCYSFSLDNSNAKSYQPQGTCNMSMYNNITLWVKTNPIDSSESYTYTVTTYAIHYNILRMVAGMGDLEFAP